MSETPIIPIQFQFDDADFKKLATQMEKLYKDAEKFAKAIKGKDTNIPETTKNLKATVSTMEKLQKKMEAYKTEATRAGKSIHGMQSEMKALKIQAQLATDPQKARAYTKEMQRLGTQIKKVKNTTTGWGKALGSFQFKFNALGNIAANVASSITRGITQALRDAVKTAIEFEKTFAEVLTLLNKSQKADFKNILKQDSVNIMKIGRASCRERV